MLDILLQYNPILLALFAGLFTWGMTAAGASLVLFFKNINQTALNIMLGFASGVMIAASFWSLLLPAFEMAESWTDPILPAWAHIMLGLIAGALLIISIDKVLPHVQMWSGVGIKTEPSKKQGNLLLIAITIHNIPEGLAYGVAFGLVATDPSTLPGAIALAIGIGIQNFPEGAAVTIPLRHANMSRKKAFFYGQASGIVEPIFAVLGALFAMTITSFLPFALAFAAGAMIYVVVEELIPEAQSYGKYSIYTSQGVMVGFIIMTFLDTSLG